MQTDKRPLQTKLPGWISIPAHPCQFLTDPYVKAPPQAVVLHCFASYNDSIFFLTKPAFLFSASASSSSQRESWTGLMVEAWQSAIHFSRLGLDTQANNPIHWRNTVTISTEKSAGAWCVHMMPPCLPPHICLPRTGPDSRNALWSQHYITLHWFHFLVTTCQYVH